MNKVKDGYLLWENNDGVKIYMLFIFVGNVYIIFNKMGIIFIIIKGFFLLVMLRKIDFIGVVVIIVKIYLFGLFVDFYRLERMFCNEMIFVLLKVIDVIVVFKLVKVIKMGDGSLNFVFLI